MFHAPPLPFLVSRGKQGDTLAPEETSDTVVPGIGVIGIGQMILRRMRYGLDQFAIRANERSRFSIVVVLTSRYVIAAPTVAVCECDQSRHATAGLAGMRDENPAMNHAEVEAEVGKRVGMLAVKHANTGFSLEVIYQVAIGKRVFALTLTIERAPDPVAVGVGKSSGLNVEERGHGNLVGD